MRRLLGLVLCFILLCATVVGCAVSPFEQPKTSIKIGVSVYDQNDTFVGVMMEQFNRFVRDKEKSEGITITVVRENADKSQVTQNNQVDNFIKDGCDVICVNLVDRNDTSAIIDKVEAANIPVLFFNRELVEEDLERWDKLYYVGAPALQSGEMQGEIVADLCWQDMAAVDKNQDGILQYVMLEGEAAHQDAIVRTESSIRTVETEGFLLERLEDEIANWNSAQAESKMTQWIATHGDNIEIVFANNDEMALGAIKALHKAEVSDENWPVVVGIDGTPTGLQAVLDGDMAGTVFNDSIGQAGALLDLALWLVLDLPLPDNIELVDGRYVRLPYRMVTSENVRNFLALTSLGTS